jgi:putative oxidoreductase
MFTKIMYKITQPILLPFWWQEVLLLVPRIIGGYLLTVEFGAPKFGLPWSPDENNLNLFEVVFWFPNDVAEYGGIFAAFPAFFAWMGAFSEGVGGILLLLGLQTRIASFLLMCTMLVALFMQQWHQGIWNMLPAMGFLWIALFYLILGSGRFGIDFLITKKTQKL